MPESFLQERRENRSNVVDVVNDHAMGSGYFQVLSLPLTKDTPNLSWLENADIIVFCQTFWQLTAWKPSSDLNSLPLCFTPKVHLQPSGISLSFLFSPPCSGFSPSCPLPLDQPFIFIRVICLKPRLTFTAFLNSYQNFYFIKLEM